MDALKKTCKQHTQITFEPLTKVFFKKFFYKVEVALILYVPRRVARSFRSRLPVKLHDLSHETAIAKCKFKDEFRVRTEGLFRSYFFTNEDDTKEFVKQNRSYIVQIVAPRHSGDTETLIDDTKIRLRDTLFWGSFRWSITFTSFQDNQYEEMRIRVCEAFGIDPSEAYRSSRVMFCYTVPRKVFVTTDQDVILVKMIAQEYISKIEKAVLRSEVDDKLGVI